MPATAGGRILDLSLSWRNIVVSWELECFLMWRRVDANPISRPGTWDANRMNTDMTGTPTRYWTRLDDGRVQCDVCPRRCRLHEGQRGLCFVRGRERDGIVLSTYGRSSGFCVDPIEKKPLNHFLPGSPVLSFGTAGCNLACKFCQNWDMSKSREMDTLADSRLSPSEWPRRRSRLGCASVAFTYNDPVVFLEYAVDVARPAAQPAFAPWR